MSKVLESLQLNQDHLRRLIEYSYDGILVTDNQGTIILANPASAQYMGRRPEELIGLNVRDLVETGTYNHSTTLEVIERRAVVTAMVKTASTGNVMSTSVPLFDDDGRIMMVLTNTRCKDLMESYLTAIEQEQENAARYKSAATYLAKLGSPENVPVAKSLAMKQVIFTADRIAKTDSTVLVLGESGTGKEVVSRYIHQQSPRAKEPFIPVNCSAIPGELLESEFFGYEKGAFSGASSRGKAGLFEMADRGTLFLDELGELPLPMQSKLLRALETGEIQRLGATTFRKTNVRLIAATNRDLKQMVAQKKFREDLYYRLNVIPIQIAPLRERPEDIRALAQEFLDSLNKKYQSRKYFSRKTINHFLSYDWPGNVRELRNVIERLVIISLGDELDFEEKNGGNQGSLPDLAAQFCPPAHYSGSLKKVMEEVEQQYIEQIMKECGGRVTEAARRLGIHRTMLYRKLEKGDYREKENGSVD